MVIHTKEKAKILKKLINSSLSLGQIKHIIYADDNGSSLMGIKTGLKELGISSTVCECELSKEAFEEMDFPVITQIRIEKEIHFVVLYGIKNNKLILADPLKRKIIRKKVDTFINGWIPFILSVNDIALNHKYYEMEKCVIGKWEIYKIISAQKGKIIISWLVSILIYITGILLTGMYSAFFDVIIPNKYIGIITSVLIGYSQFLIINFFLSYINSILSVKINNKIDELLTKKLLDSFFDKDFSVIEGFKSGELITRFRNISSIRSIFLYFIQAFPIDILGILFIYYILHRQNNELSVLLFVPLIIFVGVIYLSHEKMKEDSSLLFDKEEQFNSSLIEAITNIETLKNYQITDAFEKNLYTVITTDDLMEKINKDESFTIFFLQKNCMACKEAEAVINAYIKETNEIIYAIDLTNAKKKSYLISIINISETPTVIRYARGEEEKRLTSIFTKEEFVIFQNN